MKNEIFSFRARRKSLLHAVEGIAGFFKNEQHAWIHLFATLCVVGLGILFPVSHAEFLILVVVAGAVWVAELFNTAIEKIMDFISMEQHPAIKTIKDLSAAAVLVTALAALIAGLYIFIPKF